MWNFVKSDNSEVKLVCSHFLTKRHSINSLSEEEVTNQVCCFFNLHISATIHLQHVAVNITWHPHEQHFIFINLLFVSQWKNIWILFNQWFSIIPFPILSNGISMWTNNISVPTYELQETSPVETTDGKREPVQVEDRLLFLRSIGGVCLRVYQFPLWVINKLDLWQ